MLTPLLLALVLERNEVAPAPPQLPVLTLALVWKVSAVPLLLLLESATLLWAGDSGTGPILDTAPATGKPEPTEHSSSVLRRRGRGSTSVSASAAPLLLREPPACLARLWVGCFWLALCSAHLAPTAFMRTLPGVPAQGWGNPCMHVCLQCACVYAKVHKCTLISHSFMGSTWAEEQKEGCPAIRA